jgi:hypothetical protein
MKLFELMPFLAENKNKIKVHCARGRDNKIEALLQFSAGNFKEWQESQNKKNFERQYILSIVYMDKDEWLFAGIYESISVKESLSNDKKKIKHLYNTKLLNIRNDLIGKLVISFDKDFRASYLKLENYIDQFLVCEIRRQEYKFDPFPGFLNVHLPFELLKDIINSNETSWKSALSNVKGIYLIGDKSNGKLYVGSAYGENAFWQRWAKYADNGHGGNKRLKEIINKKGKEYCSNFTFSILEICNLNTMDDEIIRKEAFWKDRLMTMEYGYNDN